MSAHHHVIAVQDEGGRDEYWRGWDDRYTVKAAKQRVAAMVECDAVTSPEEMDRLLEKYGNDFYSLSSDCVSPGWDSIWITSCDDGCDYEKQLTGGVDLGKPAWTR